MFMFEDLDYKLEDADAFAMSINNKPLIYRLKQSQFYKRIQPIIELSKTAVYFLNSLVNNEPPYQN